MCIVIDLNAFSAVFNEHDATHHEFEPVRAWIVDGPGFLVYGGKKYRNELHKMNRYLKIIKLLKDKRKVCEICQKTVDNKEEDIINKTHNTNCNDQHIIAIFAVSKCSLFCSKDSSADQFVKNQHLYPKKSKRPKIYRGLKNKKLLNKQRICNLSMDRNTGGCW